MLCDILDSECCDIFVLCCKFLKAIVDCTFAPVSLIVSVVLFSEKRDGCHTTTIQSCIISVVKCQGQQIPMKEP